MLLEYRSTLRLSALSLLLPTAYQQLETVDQQDDIKHLSAYSPALPLHNVLSMCFHYILIHVIPSSHHTYSYILHKLKLMMVEFGTKHSDEHKPTKNLILSMVEMNMKCFTLE